MGDGEGGVPQGVLKQIPARARGEALQYFAPNKLLIDELTRIILKRIPAAQREVKREAAEEIARLVASEIFVQGSNPSTAISLLRDELERSNLFTSQAKARIAGICVEAEGPVSRASLGAKYLTRWFTYPEQKAIRAFELQYGKQIEKLTQAIVGAYPGVEKELAREIAIATICELRIIKKILSMKGEEAYAFASEFGYDKAAVRALRSEGAQKLSGRAMLNALNRIEGALNDDFMALAVELRKKGNLTVEERRLLDRLEVLTSTTGKMVWFERFAEKFRIVSRLAFGGLVIGQVVFPLGKSLGAGIYWIYRKFTDKGKFSGEQGVREPKPVTGPTTGPASRPTQSSSPVPVTANSAREELRSVVDRLPSGPAATLRTLIRIDFSGLASNEERAALNSIYTKLNNRYRTDIDAARFTYPSLKEALAQIQEQLNGGKTYSQINASLR